MLLRRVAVCHALDDSSDDAMLSLGTARTSTKLPSVPHAKALLAEFYGHGLQGLWAAVEKVIPDIRSRTEIEMVRC